MRYLAKDKKTGELIEPNRAAIDLEWCLDTKTGVSKQFNEQQIVTEPITVTVLLSKVQCLLGESIDYTITFSEQITVPFIVPISVSDRNGNHITNIGCTVENGVATGSFIMAVAGDFTITDEAINYHHTVIEAPLKLVEQPWLRVYQ